MPNVRIGSSLSEAGLVHSPELNRFGTCLCDDVRLATRRIGGMTISGDQCCAFRLGAWI
jgi:hypothetical protein